MWKCIIRCGNSHNITETDLDKLKLYNRSPEKALMLLLQKRTQSKFKLLPREIYLILISYIIMNTSAHKIQSISLLSSRFHEILQCLMESIFILTGQMPKPLRQFISDPSRKQNSMSGILISSGELQSISPGSKALHIAGGAFVD